MKDWLEFCLRNSLAPHVSCLLLLAISVFLTSGLECYRCGQYTDGPGSITPCINYTDALHLKECPQEANKQCIKYVNEGTTVRECADECNEKRSDSWGTSIYCCSEDGCNSAPSGQLSPAAGTIMSAVAFWTTFCSSPSTSP